MSTHPSDAQLIWRIQSGETEAFEAIFTRYSQIITTHIARIVRDNAVVEDLVKEVFLWVWTRADQWNGLGKVEGWIYRIATNLSLNHLRSVKRRPQQRFEMLANDIGDDEGISAPRASTSWRVPGELFVQGLSSHGLQPSVRWIRWWT